MKGESRFLPLVRQISRQVILADLLNYLDEFGAALSREPGAQLSKV
jgi:hypothetical protein